MGKSSEVNLDAMGKKLTVKHMDKVNKARKDSDGNKTGAALGGTQN